MSMRTGGDADKVGNHYESSWIVKQMLQIVGGVDGSIYLEPLNELGEGIEFVLKKNGRTEAHQVKRNNGTAETWRLGDLKKRGVLQAARKHVAADREFVFVSTTNSPFADDLIMRAERSPNLDEFLSDLANDIKRQDGFNKACSANGFASPAVAWSTLKRMRLHILSQAELRDQNLAMVATCLTGGTDEAKIAALADIANENLSVELDYSKLIACLKTYGLSPGRPDLQPLSHTINTSLSNWLDSTAKRLIKPSIPRDESKNIVELLGVGNKCVILLAPGGGGKSAVLHESITMLNAENWKIFPFRLDRLSSFSSTKELGSKLGLDNSPVVSLHMLAGDTDSLLVIDQLDAISSASGRMPESFDAVAGLVREAQNFPKMRVVLACRQFDLDHDDEIRGLVVSNHAVKVSVKPLTEQQIGTVLSSIGVSPSIFNGKQLEILKSPLHLQLFCSLEHDPDAPTFDSVNDLMDKYFEKRRKDCEENLKRSVKFEKILQLLSEKMSSEQLLSVPVSVLRHDDLESDADAMVSAGVLTKDGNQIAFFHETFFDFAFARHWITRDESLVQFVTGTEQELFRRAQLRQILAYLKSEDEARFVAELEDLLNSDEVRFHLKIVSLNILQGIQNPNDAEVAMVKRLVENKQLPTNQVWRAVSSDAWFTALDNAGLIEEWLVSEDDTTSDMAVRLMITAVKSFPERSVEILKKCKLSMSRFPESLRFLVRFAEIEENLYMFNLLLEETRLGLYDGLDHELFLQFHDFGKKRPEQAVKLIKTFLIDRPNAYDLNKSSKVAAIDGRDYGEADIITNAALGDAKQFCEIFVPYVLKVAELTELDKEVPIHDRHFTYIPMIGGGYQDVDDAIIYSTLQALKLIVETDSELAPKYIESLIANDHAVAQWLAYKAITKDTALARKYVSQMLLDRDWWHRAVDSNILADYIRSLDLATDDTLRAHVEKAILEVKPVSRWKAQERQWYVNAAYLTYLPAIGEELLSEEAKRKLGEAERASGTTPPRRVNSSEGGWIKSPISDEQAVHLTDEQWLAAIKKYDKDSSDLRGLRGGAGELSHILENQTKKDPIRFANLSGKFDATTHAYYLGAVLRGLGGADAPLDPDVVADTVERLAEFNDTEVDRWISYPLKRVAINSIPARLVTVLVERALASANPKSSASFTDEDGTVHLISAGINTASGGIAYSLSDLLSMDGNGKITALVIGSLSQMASDDSVAVRACVARLITTAIRHAPNEALEAYRMLVEAEDILFTAGEVERLTANIASIDIDVALEVVKRMLASDKPEVLMSAGRLSAYLAVNYDVEGMLESAVSSKDENVREGAASVCANLISQSSHRDRIDPYVARLCQDSSEKVLKAISGFAMELRGEPLSNYEDILLSLINSEAFQFANPQLFLTIEYAPDKVDAIALACAGRFIEVYGKDSSDLSTAAAGDAETVGKLLLTAYTQSEDIAQRSEILDLLDELLSYGAYGVADLVTGAER